MKEKHPSLKINMLLNAIKGMLSIIFPLVSFPYVTNILGVTNIGRYNFANSIIAYFLLIAALGIKTYAVREGAMLRRSREDFGRFANQIFTINVISTVITYALFVLSMGIVPKFAEYKTILVILSLQIAFTTLGVEWIYTIYEDFVYITVLSIIAHIVSLGCLFLLIHTETDLNKYVGIVVASSVGSNIVNYIHCRKYCSLRLVKSIQWDKHIKPIMVLFAMQIATTIYISSDTTILGFLCDDDVVGIYSVSTKIYLIVKTILASVIIVSIPRLASLHGKDNKEEFNYVAKDIYSTLLTVVTPAIVGMILMRREIILIISNKSYLSAASSLTLLCIALLFSLCAWFWGQCILIPLKMEMFVFKSTVISAVINIVLNFIIIPIWAENAAALTTLIAEAVAFFVQWYKGRKYVHLIDMWKTYLKICLGCLTIVVVFIAFQPLRFHMILYTLVVIAASVISYGAMEIILKNKAVYGVLDIVRKKNKHKLYYKMKGNIMIELTGKDFFQVRNNYECNAGISSKLKYGERRTYPQFSIMIPTFLRNNYLKDTIESALSQKTQIDFEVVVVDNNPDEEDTSTLEIIKKYDTKRVSYYKNDENLGMFGNWNRCLELANAEWVLILHDDDTIKDNYISSMMKIITEYPYVSCIGCGRTLIDGVGNEIPESKMSLKRQLAKKILQRNSYSLNVRDFFYTHPINIMGLTINKKKAIEIGGFDNTWDPTSDYIFILNMVERYPVRCTDEKLIYYRKAVNASLSPKHLVGMVEVDAYMRKDINRRYQIMKEGKELEFRSAIVLNHEDNLAKEWFMKLELEQREAVLSEYESFNSKMNIIHVSEKEKRKVAWKQRYYIFWMRFFRK